MDIGVIDRLFVADLIRPKDVRWCYKSFVQAGRAFDCTRERDHANRRDSQLAQEFRDEFCQQVSNTSEGV